MRYYIYAVYFHICTALFQQFLVVFNKNTSRKFVKYIRQPLWKSAVTITNQKGLNREALACKVVFT